MHDEREAATVPRTTTSGNIKTTAEFVDRGKAGTIEICSFFFSRAAAVVDFRPVWLSGCLPAGTRGRQSCGDPPWDPSGLLFPV